MIGFPLCSLIIYTLSLGSFSSIEFPIFSLYFLIKFRRFFHQLNSQFPLQSLTRFKKFSLPKPWLQTFTCLSELVSKREGNCNVIKLHNQLRDRSKLIGTISYHNLSQSWLNHPSPDLSFKSTYVINLLIELATSLAYGTLFSQTNIRT